MDDVCVTAETDVSARRSRRCGRSTRSESTYQQVHHTRSQYGTLYRRRYVTANFHQRHYVMTRPPLSPSCHWVSGFLAAHQHTKGHNRYIQCESKKSPAEDLWQFFQNCSEFSNQISHAYYAFLSTLEYEFLFNYLQLWWSYVIFSMATQFTPCVQNVHHRPKRTLTFFPNS